MFQSLQLFGRSVFACLLFALPVTTALAQEDKVMGVADKVIAIVGRNRIILQSELDVQFTEAKRRDPALSDTAKPLMLQQMVLEKLLVEQAERDSLLVSAEEVEGNLENKMRYFIRLYGSKEKLEEAAGKTVYQIKDDNRDLIRDQMLAEKMRNKILENVKITPAEVRSFYEKIPLDSLPFFPATVEAGQVVVDPPVSAELDKYAKEKLEDIRKQIVEGGKSFETMAGVYSDDPGSRDNGGRYNDVTRGGGWAPEFVAATFRLQNGEISPLVKTTFGYHIIQMIRRKGEAADIRHILIRPERTSADFKKAFEKLDSVRALLIAGNISFSEAVGKYSTDEAAKQTGGMILNPQTGAAQLDVAELDPALVLMLDTLKEGGYSQPQMFQTERGEKSARIVFLRARTKPHKANLYDDYSRIQQVALQQKQNTKLETWLRRKLPSYYIRISPEYRKGQAFADWGLARN